MYDSLFSPKMHTLSKKTKVDKMILLLKNILFDILTKTLCIFVSIDQTNLIRKTLKYYLLHLDINTKEIIQKIIHMRLNFLKQNTPLKNK
jgi:hypothetical protein